MTTEMQNVDVSTLAGVHAARKLLAEGWKLAKRHKGLHGADWCQFYRITK